MISTKNYDLLKDRKSVQSFCKAASVLDAILCQQWEYRYYSYNANWGEGEEFCEMRNGEGDQVLLLFTEEGCVINGFAHEVEQQDKVKLVKGLPVVFNEFVYGEPIASIGTTFCLWSIADAGWQIGEIDGTEDNSEELLRLFDGNPQSYVDWATGYFDSFKESGIPLETVAAIYSGEMLTKEMVLSLVNELEDWDLLVADLEEINYPFEF